MESQENLPKEEKEDGELEEGELEEDEGEGPALPLGQGDPGPADKKMDSEDDGHNPTELDAREEGKRERRESRESKEEKKRKHREDDEEKEKRKKKKKKKKMHMSSEGEEEEGCSQKVHHHKIVPQAFDSNMGFDAMLQQEMLLRGRSPPPGMIPYGPPPGQFVFRGRPMSDYESFESGSDSEMRERQARRPRRLNRRFRRSRSRSRSPSRKNEAICMYYMQGSCQRGKGCPYSHDIQPQRKMELCKFYMMDCCAKKDKCLYMHKDFPCKHYHTGVKCKSADKCKFSHDYLSDAARTVLLKHIELAPKDILGDFPRLTKDAAQLVVAITEAHRRGAPMDVENIPGIMDFKGRGFKYVDKAIKNLLKKQEARMKNMQKDQLYHECGGGGGERRTPEHHHHHHHPHHQPHLHPHHQPQEEGGITPPRHSFTPPLNEDQGCDELSQKNGNSSSNTGPNSSSHMNNAPGGHGQAGANTNRKLGSFMTARMPQKQRELFQRIEQQHSVHHEQEDTPLECPLDDTPTNTSNVNWYSSDEDGESATTARMQGQSSNAGGSMSPSRTPPLPSPSTTSPNNFPSSEKQGSSPAGPSTPQKGAFPGINLDNINISSDLASVLSALKNQNAASNNRNSSEDSGRDQRLQSPRGKDPREVPRDSRNLRDATMDHQDPPRGSREMSRGQGEMFRDSRDTIQSPRGSAEYPSHPWPAPGMQDPWDCSKDQQDQQQRNFLDTRETSDVDHDQRHRTKDVDLRVIPGMENTRNQGSNVKGAQFDTDMRISSESSIYDVDLRQLNLPNNYQANEEDMSSLPFKVPVHTPAKEIFASISSHSPMYYQLVKVTIPKPNFTHLKINKDDPRVMEDPRIRRMLRRSSTEETSNLSPRTPSRYEMEAPMSPPPVLPSKGDLKFSDSDSRDPRMPFSRDPRNEARAEPRVDPRMNVRVDPRVGNRSDPRADARDPRTEQMNDMRNQEMRMGGMYGGGNNGGMMDGGMQYMNMGPGPMGGMMPQNNMNPRDKPGLLGPAPMAFNPGFPHNMGPRMPPFMMGQMGPNSGYYPEETGEMMGGAGFPQGGPGWGGRMPANDPRLKREMGEGNRSYTPPPVS